ncbi:MAG: ATP-binding cassette domain-containing protein [Clostridiales bacterium]|nr:ATP-binding cassette domain-containing protein [Clostridiales bacterium]
MRDIAISVRNLVKRFDEETVLRGISHDFEAGKIHGIVGNNGSGKTVFFKCICGFLVPEEGEVSVCGKSICKDADFPESVGIIIEAPGFLSNISGFKNLKLLAALGGKISDEKIRETIEMVGLDPKSRKHVGKYSLGMKQRLGIAQAIMETPDCIIFDEPFNGLDKHGVAEMKVLIKGLRKDGKTILMASHNPADIEELCDSVHEMEAGLLSERE